MDKCHILLGRPWQHDVDATHRGKRNICVFIWKDKRVTMKSISPIPNPTKEETKIIAICNRGEFFVKSKETKKELCSSGQGRGYFLY